MSYPKKMMIALIILWGLYWFVITEQGQAFHFFHDTEIVTHDVKSIEHSNELSKAENDTEHVDELSKMEHELSDVKKVECDRLHIEYSLRHPPGTKPKGLRGLHGCALFRQDAQFHDIHPNVVSVLGANFHIGLGGF